MNYPRTSRLLDIYLKTTWTVFSSTRIEYRPFKQRKNAHLSLSERNRLKRELFAYGKNPQMSRIWLWHFSGSAINWPPGSRAGSVILLLRIRFRILIMYQRYQRNARKSSIFYNIQRLLPISQHIFFNGHTNVQVGSGSRAWSGRIRNELTSMIRIRSSWLQVCGSGSNRNLYKNKYITT